MQWIDSISDTELLDYLPQLVQVCAGRGMLCGVCTGRGTLFGMFAGTEMLFWMSPRWGCCMGGVLGQGCYFG